MLAYSLTPQQRASRLADARRIIREEEMADDAYKVTPIGREVELHLQARLWEGCAESYYKHIEFVLSKLALDYADFTLEQLVAGREGGQRIGSFLQEYWGARAQSTKAFYKAILSEFFKWAMREGIIDRNPVDLLRPPHRKEEVQIEVFKSAEVAALVAGQARLRDRVAVMLLFDCGLRKTELSRIQFKHFDLGASRVMIFGKGKTVRPQFIRGEYTRTEIEKHILERNPEPDHYLLYPERHHRKGHWPDYTWIRHEYPERPLSGQAMHEWWYRRLEDAGLVRKGTRSGKKLHATRHTAGTEVLAQTGGDLELTRIFMRHASVATTQRYMHYADSYVGRRLRENEPEWARLLKSSGTDSGD